MNPQTTCYWLNSIGLVFVHIKSLEITQMIQGFALDIPGHHWAYIHCLCSGYQWITNHLRDHSRHRPWSHFDRRNPRYLGNLRSHNHPLRGHGGYGRLQPSGDVWASHRRRFVEEMLYRMKVCYRCYPRTQLIYLLFVFLKLYRDRTERRKGSNAWCNWMRCLYVECTCSCFSSVCKSIKFIGFISVVDFFGVYMQTTRPITPCIAWSPRWHENWYVLHMHIVNPCVYGWW